MAVTSVASINVFPPSAAASQTVAPPAPSSPTVSSTTPSVINSISSGTGPGAIVATAADIQSSVNGINAGIENESQIVWSKAVNLTPEQIAQGEALLAERTQAAEGATIAFADEQGLQGISFNFLPIDFSSSTSGSQSASVVATAPQASAGTSNSDPEATPAELPSSVISPSSTGSQGVSSQNQGSPQTPNLILSTGATSSSTSAANVALSVLTAASQQSSSQTATTPTTKQLYDFYA